MTLLIKCNNRFLIFIICFLTLNLSPCFAASACPDFPFFKPTSGPLALMNCDFHHTYEDRIKEIIATFGAEGGRPIILNLGGTLILKYNGVTKQIDITGATYQNVKAFAHAILTVFLTLAHSKPGKLNPHIKSEIELHKMHLQQSISAISSLNLPPPAVQAVTKIGTMSEAYLNKILLKGAWSENEFKLFFKKAKPLIYDLTLIATQAEYQALDKAIKPWLAQMSVADKKKIGVVVATAHQARTKEISLQYFGKLFGYRFGEGALSEKGFVVIEGIFDESSALNLLARHYLDREAGQTMFENPSRLQRDLLSDAGAALL